ncbi:DUF4133 domain-containing protein [Pontibacter pamirensis]|uniref:DUF4133 domain-containing protein n=1 Tax=Pontibacter pamirensis TaxID=2562824 RepID=UPI001389D780|nr:DUF4133 domain-containing protein [Pontibacter pamirensis]
METSVYRINKGINRPIEFKGLRAQYIGYLAAGLVALLLGFTLLYLARVNLVLCITTVFLSGGALFAGVYHLNSTYGQYGLLKRFARRSVPRCVRIRSRKVFLNLKRKEETHGDGK